jgi:hypothetical protein
MSTPNRPDDEVVPIGRIRPSQLYLDAEKLAAVLEQFDGEGHDYGPLPVYEFDGELSLTDGHTRAFVAHLVGLRELRVTHDHALPREYDVEVYRTCIEWWTEADVRTVADFAGRVVDAGTFEERWIQRCHELDAYTE